MSEPLVDGFRPQESVPAPISPLPIVAFENAPSAAVLCVAPDPAAGIHAATVGQPMQVEVQAIAPAGGKPLQGVLRWRAFRSAQWHEEDLQPNGPSGFIGQWVPPAIGDYQWSVELWHAGDANHEGSSEPDRYGRARAESAVVRDGDWYIAARKPLAELAEQIVDQPVLLLPPVFGMADPLRVGLHGKGHYTIDPSLGTTRDFGLLAASAHRNGTMPAMSLPLLCSREHPFRQRHPDHFDDDGVPELLSGDWQERWDEWQAVFRFWIVQGIDLFYLPDADLAPLSFWQRLISRIRADFPGIAFAAPGPEAPEHAAHWLNAGFSSLCDIDIASPILSADPAATDTGNLQPLAPLPAFEPDDRDGGIDCFCSNPNLSVTLFPDQHGSGELHVVNTTPMQKQAGHVHLDAEVLDLQEYECYFMKSFADGRAYRWSGTTNYLSLEAGEPVMKFRIERN